MAVLTLEDRSGAVEVVVFPNTYGKCEGLIETDRMVLVRGSSRRMKSLFACSQPSCCPSPVSLSG